MWIDWKARALHIRSTFGSVCVSVSTILTIDWEQKTFSLFFEKLKSNKINEPRLVNSAERISLFRPELSLAAELRWWNAEICNNVNEENSRAMILIFEDHSSDAWIKLRDFPFSHHVGRKFNKFSTSSNHELSTHRLMFPVNIIKCRMLRSVGMKRKLSDRNARSERLTLDVN